MTGGLYGAFGGGQHGSSTVNYGQPVDYSEAMTVESNNSKTTALAQIQSQEFAMQQASLDREMQAAANLELGLDRFDTNLQTAKLSYLQSMTAESDRHQEKLAALGADFPSPSEGQL